MVHKVNIKARINRYLRIFKGNILSETAIIKKRSTNSYSYLLVVFIVIFIIPVYPMFSSVVHSNTQYDFYRWDIDENSIIWAYYWWDIWEDAWGIPMMESSDYFLSVNTILNDERDLEWTNEIVDYEVKPWESFYSIAYNFNVSSNSIYWSNNFSKDHVLHPWDIIKIPPVSWLIHQVKLGDTISSISKEYNIESEKILSQNLLSKDDWLSVWEVLVIPWAIKKVIKPVVQPIYKKIPEKYISKKSNKKLDKGYNFSKYADSEIVKSWWEYKLVWRKPKHSFYWWNCTWYVAQYKNVNWAWNANQWLKNAKKAWHLTWSNPSIWAIVVFDGRWYNPRYWHVWIVMGIKDGNIIISDMNYRRINEVTYRKVPINNRAIKWYIYID